MSDFHIPEQNRCYTDQENRRYTDQDKNEILPSVSVKSRTRLMDDMDNISMCLYVFWSDLWGVRLFAAPTPFARLLQICEAEWVLL